MNVPKLAKTICLGVSISKIGLPKGKRAGTVELEITGLEQIKITGRHMFMVL